jgi:hypothetical protein
MVRETLLVFVEGGSDRRFFERAIQPFALPLRMRVVEYASVPNREINRILVEKRRIGSPCMFVKDRDLAPCATSRKEKVQETHPPLAARDIVVVSREIESWYMAGITKETAKRLGIRNLPDKTDECVKRDFDQCKPSRFKSDIDFMLEILKQFDVPLARSRNSSFDYLLRRIEALLA